MGQKYSVKFNNNTGTDGTFMMFTQGVDAGRDDLKTLAWFAKKVNNSTNTSFDWEVDFSLQWAESGTLSKGVRFVAGQNMPVVMPNSSKAYLDYNGAFKFNGAEQGPQDRFDVYQSANIPVDNSGSVALAIGGKPACAVPVHPNVVVTFKPDLKYYAAYVLSTVQTSEVIEIDQISSVYPVEFASGVSDIELTLNPHFDWAEVDH